MILGSEMSKSVAALDCSGLSHVLCVGREPGLMATGHSAVSSAPRQHSPLSQHSHQPGQTIRPGTGLCASKYTWTMEPPLQSAAIAGAQQRRVQT